jgi:hypothetical protein
VRASVHVNASRGTDLGPGGVSRPVGTQCPRSPALDRRSYCLVNSAILINSEPFTFMSRTMVFNNKTLQGRFSLNCKVLWTLLHGSFNAYVRSSLCVFK